MGEQRRALLGLHGGQGTETIVGTLVSQAGYDITIVNTLGEMLGEMGVTESEIQSAPPANPFDMYVMDVNLGEPDGETIKPAESVWQYVKHQMPPANFVAISDNDNAVNAAVKAGINTSQEPVKPSL
jgi:hypothetical protein